MPKIMHVTDAFNGGVFEVILELTKLYPNHEYTILYRSHDWDPKSNEGKFDSSNIKMIKWEKSLFSKYIQLLKLIITEKPDLIHLHSTLAGLVGRLMPGASGFSIYSPHAFAFQKLDIPKMARSCIFVLEKNLQKRTKANVAFWPIEMSLFKELNGKAETIFAPVMIEKYRQNARGDLKGAIQKLEFSTLHMISIGRLAPQKDPGFFLEVVNELKNVIPVFPIWYGDGTQFPETELLKSGIQKRGWMEQDEIFRELQGKRVVAVLTSRWESGPITLFEVLNAGIPVVCRSIDAITGYGLGDGDSPKELAQRIIRIDSSIDLSSLAAQQFETVLKNLPDSQFSKLTELYDLTSSNF
jgi:glycosyltransferase involved in cell wall biosynthesis